MARKSRRARRRSAARDSARVAARPVTKDAKVTDANRPVASSAAEFTQQYAYVYGDLKRIAIMAGALFAVLIALSFLIR
jgi:hypothetical protein